MDEFRQSDEQTSAITEYEAELSNKQVISDEVVESLLKDTSDLRLKVCHACDGCKDDSGECPEYCPMNAVCQHLTGAWCLLTQMKHNLASASTKNVV